MISIKWVHTSNAGKTATALPHINDTRFILRIALMHLHDILAHPLFVRFWPRAFAPPSLRHLRRCDQNLTLSRQAKVLISQFDLFEMLTLNQLIEVIWLRCSLLHFIVAVSVCLFVCLLFISERERLNFTKRKNCTPTHVKQITEMRS